MYYIKDRSDFNVMNPQGFFINDIKIARALFQDGKYAHEQSLINWCAQNFANKDKVFIDIGAHIGAYSCTLAPRFKKTIAFEPNNEVYNCMCANIYLKGLSDKIETHRIGISDKDTKITYYFRGGDGGGNGFEEIKLDDLENLQGKEFETVQKEEFEVRTLDSFKLDNVGFIKIDVEGHELSALKGAVETIRRNNYPPIIFESWRPGEHPGLNEEYTLNLRKELFEFIRELGYKVKPIAGWNEIFLAVYENEKEGKILKDIQEMDIWINSVGGTRTNYVTDLLAQKYKVRPEVWDIYACHYIRPLPGLNKYIFCFTNDIGVALTSQLKRNTRSFDKANAKNLDYSIKNWLDLCEEQIYNWTQSNLPIYLINTDYLNEIADDFQKEFGVKIEGFKERTTHSMDRRLIPHVEQITRINDYLARLPWFRKPCNNS